MRTLSINATDDEIRSLVVDWSELMAAKRFDDAFGMLAFGNAEWHWTPQLLADTIRGYGVPDIDNFTKQIMLKAWDVNEFEITTLDGRTDREEIINSIKIDRESLGSLDPDRYLGHVHYFDLPLCNDRSDLTARFHILRIGDDKLALELLDIHVL